MYEEELELVKADIAVEAKKRLALKRLDCFVLDNSMRESTVGQLKGHTLENKWKIYDEIKKCGFKNIIVAAFSHMTRVDDTFLGQLSEKEEDMTSMFAFTEVTEGVNQGEVDTKTIPVGMVKMKQFGLINPIIEIDLANKSTSINWKKKFSIEDMCDLLDERFQWCRENLSPDGRCLVNIRDFPLAMRSRPERVFAVVDHLASLPKKKRIFGIIFEEPTGKILPEEMGAWTAAVRRLMDANNWKGHLLVHVHEKYGMAEITQLECLSSGANGIWASVAQEGAYLGHACSSVTLLNLIRMGNKKVLKDYNCTYLRKAAIAVTKITTGKDPHPKQVVYGDRALDFTFDFGGIAGGQLAKREFDMAEFFGVTAPIRISTLASNDMIKNRLVNVFGKNPDFDLDMAGKMKEVMLEDLRNNRKEEYMSPPGLALLFDRSGGKVTPEMGTLIAKMEYASHHEEKVINDVRAIWDAWDVQEDKQNDNCLQFNSFYNGFMAPYFGCFKCDDTKRGLKAINMDQDDLIDWYEFRVYLKWAMHQYPDIKDADELLSVAFRKGIIPAMRDEEIIDE